MQWSQLKKRIEAGFADSVQGRVEVWATRYRHASEQAGEAWITFDRHRLVSMGSWRYELELSQAQALLMEEADVDGHLASGQDHGDTHAAADDGAANEAADAAARIVHDQGIYALWDAYASFNEYLNLSIDDILASDNPLIRAIGMLDRRVGKRRLRSYDAREQPLLVQKLFACRCECEGIRPLGARSAIIPADPRL